MMRRSSLAGIVLTTCASSATVFGGAGAPEHPSQSHFRVIDKQPEVACPVPVAESARDGETGRQGDREIGGRGEARMVIETLIANVAATDHQGAPELEQDANLRNSSQRTAPDERTAFLSRLFETAAPKQESDRKYALAELFQRRSELKKAGGRVDFAHQPRDVAASPASWQASQSAAAASKPQKQTAQNQKYALAAAFQEETAENESVENAMLIQPTPPAPTPADEYEADVSNEIPPETEGVEPVVPPQPGSEADSPGMTLDEMISMALQANPTIAESFASIQQSQGERAQSGFYPNPRSGYAAAEIGDDGTAGKQGIFIGQTFVTADKLEWNRAVASGAVRFAEAQSEAQRLRVLTDTTIRFYEALGTQRLVEISQEIQGNAQQNYEAIQGLEKAGEAANADLLQAETELERANVRLRQAEARAEAAWRRLTVVVGRPNLSRTKLAGELATNSELDQFEVVWEYLRANSPELGAASAKVARTRAKIGREEAQAIPNLRANNQVFYDYASQTTLVGMQWTVPVPIIHKNEGAITAAQAAHIRACREYERVELELRDRLVQAMRDVNVAEAQVDTYREEVIPAATESLDLVRQGYEQGQFSVLRLITSQQIYADTSAEYVQSLIDLRIAESKVDGLLLTGGLTEPVEPVPVDGFSGLSGVPRAN